jgi:hypothetical protein
MKMLHMRFKIEIISGKKADKEIRREITEVVYFL